MGITEALTLLFVVMKLVGKIDWSWWLVCLPEFFGAAFYIGIMIWDITDRVVNNEAMRKWSRGK